jgi:hypothetical protein
MSDDELDLSKIMGGDIPPEPAFASRVLRMAQAEFAPLPAGRLGTNVVGSALVPALLVAAVVGKTANTVQAIRVVFDEVGEHGEHGPALPPTNQEE